MAEKNRQKMISQAAQIAQQTQASQQVKKFSVIHWVRVNYNDNNILTCYKNFIDILIPHILSLEKIKKSMLLTKKYKYFFYA